MNKLKRITAALIASAMTTALMGANTMHADEEYLISSDDPRYKYLELDDGTIAIASSEYSRKVIEGDVTLPSVLDGRNVSAIAPSGFASCPITSVVIPEGVEEIGTLAFSDCEKLKTADIPETVKKVGATSFSKTELEKTMLKNSDPEFAMLDDRILYLYTGSEKNVEIPEGVRVIADSAFADNGVYSGNEIASVTMPESLEYIGDNCFENCDSLKKMIFRINLKEVGENAISKKVGIYGYLKSSAQDFAKANGNTFTALLKDGETKIESGFDKGFKKYYFSTDKEFSTEGVHVYRRYSNGTREELKTLKWSFDTTPEKLYAETHKKADEPAVTTVPAASQPSTSETTTTSVLSTEVTE